jgi:hypothetical protein
VSVPLAVGSAVTSSLATKNVHALQFVVADRCSPSKRSSLVSYAGLPHGGVAKPSCTPGGTNQRLPLCAIET